MCVLVCMCVCLWAKIYINEYMCESKGIVLRIYAYVCVCVFAYCMKWYMREHKEVVLPVYVYFCSIIMATLQELYCLHICVRLFIYLNGYMYASKRNVSVVYVYVCVFVCVYVYLFILFFLMGICTHVKELYRSCMKVRVYTCIYVCIYVYLYQECFPSFYTLRYLHI